MRVDEPSLWLRPDYRTLRKASTHTQSSGDLVGWTASWLWAL